MTHEHMSSTGSNGSQSLSPPIWYEHTNLLTLKNCPPICYKVSDHLNFLKEHFHMRLRLLKARLYIVMVKASRSRCISLYVAAVAPYAVFVYQCL